MKKILLLFVVAVLSFSCSNIQNVFNKTEGATYKQINEREVPERYVKDMKYNRPKINQVKWEKVDSLTYNAKFVDNNNNMRVKYSNTGTETHWIIPSEYIPSNINDFIKSSYKDYKSNEVYIADIRNKKVYRACISNKRDKKDIRVLEFDLVGQFSSEVKY